MSPIRDESPLTDTISAPDPALGGESAALRFAKTYLIKYGLLIALVVICVIFALLEPKIFPTLNNAKAILTQASPLAVVAFGLTLALTMGDFDLSFGPAAGLCGATAVVLMSEHGTPWPLAIVLALVIGSAAGAFNGVLVSFLGGTPFIITLATGTMFTGVEYLLTGQKTLFEGIPESYIDIGQSSLVFGINTQVFVALGVFILGYLWLAQSEPGRYMKAIGGSIETARLSGINVRVLRATGFVAVGIAAAIAGILLTARGASSTPAQGVPLLLPAYAGVFLGSTAFRPGEFNMVGTLCGVVLLQVLENGLTLVSASPALINIVQGGVLIIAILPSFNASRRS